MIFGNNNSIVSLDESEINEIESFYENSVSNDNFKDTPLSLMTTNFLAEMQYNSILTLGYINESVVGIEESNIIDWFLTKIKEAIKKAQEFFINLGIKIRNYFNGYKRKFKSLQNKVWYETNGKATKELAYNLSDEKLKAIHLSINKYRTDVKDIGITEANNYLDSASRTYINNVNDSIIREKNIQESYEELNSEKENIKAIYMKYLFADFQKNYYYSTPDGKEVKSRNGMSYNASTGSADYITKGETKVVPNDVVITSGFPNDGIMGKIDSRATTDTINSSKSSIDSYIRDYFIGSDVEMITYDGKEILANFDTFAQYACGKEYEIVQRNFEKADKVLLKIIKNLKAMNTKIEKAMDKSNNDRISGFKHNIIVLLLNIYITSEMQVASLIMNHSYATLEKMDKYGMFLKTYKKKVEESK